MTGDERTLEVETRVDAPAEVVFTYFTDPEKYRRWKGVGAELDPRPGGTYRVDMGPNGWVSGRFVSVDPPDHIVFTWGWEGDPAIPPGATRVEVTLVPDGDATIVRLKHSGFPDDQAAEQHEQGWRHFLSRLSVAAPGGDPGPDPLSGAAP
jgi:uncharacterized protein YndB with AHSA1/START domain